jgi:hypothetical protein
MKSKKCLAISADSHYSNTSIGFSYIDPMCAKGEGYGDPSVWCLKQTHKQTNKQAKYIAKNEALVANTSTM